MAPILQTLQVKQTVHGWRIKDELISEILQWALTHVPSRVIRPAKTYIHRRCRDTGCRLEDLSKAMIDKERWRGRVQKISTTRWWCCKLIRNPCRDLIHSFSIIGYSWVAKYKWLLLQGLKEKIVFHKIKKSHVSTNLLTNAGCDVNIITKRLNGLSCRILWYISHAFWTCSWLI